MGKWKTIIESGLDMAVVYDKEILYSLSVTGNDHLIIRHMILYSHYTNTELPSMIQPLFANAFTNDLS